MKKTLKEFYVEMMEAEGVKSEDYLKLNYFNEFLSEGSEWVTEHDRDEHRWYYFVWNVVSFVIDEETRYFMTTTQEATGDTWLEASDSYMEFEEVKEVFPHQVMTTVYRTSPQEKKV